MSEKNFVTFIDFGSSKIRIGVFDNNFSKNILFYEKNCISNLNSNSFDLDNSKQIIQELVQSSEKELGFHINVVNLMIDTSDLFSIDLSIKKNFEGKQVNTDDIKYLLQEAKQLIQKNNFDKKIIHIILKQLIFDEKILYSIPTEVIDCDHLTLEIKFLCSSNLIFEQLINYFKENHISIDQILCSSYIKSVNYNQLFKNKTKYVSYSFYRIPRSGFTNRNIKN